MAYATGSTILAADINDFLTRTRDVYGSGTGDRGYGQTTFSQAAVGTGTTILASQWSTLTNMISVCATHQGTSVTLPTFTAGGTVSVGSGLSAAVTGIENNRLIAAAGSMTLLSSATSRTQSVAWSTSISTTVNAAWASEDAARFFFNAGGEIRIRFAQTTNASTQDADWVDIFTNKVGTITLRANTSTRSGAAGTASGSGFYQIGTTSTSIYNGTNIGGGAYVANDVLVNALVLNRTATNGGNGNTVQFTIQLNDDHANAFFDSVSGGTVVHFDVYRPTYLSAIAAPTWSLVSGF
jgi:hypothetical protein